MPRISCIPKNHTSHSVYAVKARQIAPAKPDFASQQYNARNLVHKRKMSVKELRENQRITSFLAFCQPSLRSTVKSCCRSQKCFALLIHKSIFSRLGVGTNSAFSSNAGKGQLSSTLTSLLVIACAARNLDHRYTL